MIIIKAFGTRLSHTDYEIITKMINVVSQDAEIKIIDLMSYDIDVSAEDIVFLYGKRAADKFKSYSAKAIFEFPKPFQLKDIPANKERRKEAFEKLKYIKENIDNLTKINQSDIILDENLPQLTSKEVEELEKILNQKGITSWITKTKLGKEIKITSSVDENDKIMQITFAELYGLKTVMETFNVTEIKVE